MTFDFRSPFYCLLLLLGLQCVVPTTMEAWQDTPEDIARLQAKVQSISVELQQLHQLVDAKQLEQRQLRSKIKAMKLAGRPASGQSSIKVVTRYDGRYPRPIHPTNRQSPSDVYIAFEKLAAGETPDGWRQLDETGNWQIEHHLDAPSGVAKLRHHVDPAANSNSVLILDASHVQYKDLELSAQLRWLAPENAAGLVWQFVDQHNYYFALVKPKQRQVEVYRKRNGHLKQISSASIEQAISKWNTLQVVVQDDQVQLLLNRQPLSTIHSVRSAGKGKIGLISAGMVEFDSVKIKSLDR